ncbi:MarR family winged helix-turn-helix transcriptional regulator [Oryzobacter terrae]|uniref:MarR family winged helix-turn-helix transcriptional regulator n=1 Tax=Oryzobacter terrae TaxID=1620385 RepID=UPI00366D65C5
MTDPPWLTAPEQRLWRAWLELGSALSAALHRDLQASSGLSLPDFDVLVRLTESTGGRVRVSELARLLDWERSRLSHHVTRMERRGLVARDDCVDDGRGAFVLVTPEGRRTIEQAAPHHVRTVRRLFVDELTTEEVDVLTPVLERLVARVAAGGGPQDRATTSG